jgi:6-pyruvoyltetrahydropterin/6-carboxytetrahydropterin synthase
VLLDRVLGDEVRERFDHRNINTDVPEFADGHLVPTGENLALFIADRVQRRLDAEAGAGAPRVTRVVVAEDETMSVAYEPEVDA